MLILLGAQTFTIRPFFFFVILMITICASSQAEEICGRTALINSQKVLIDTNSVQKGEGLQHYIEKDKVASEWLDKYRKGVEIHWQNAAIGTLGSAMILTATMTNRNSVAKNKFLIGGVALLAVNFFLARTFEYNNEANLQNAIDEYNLRNLPKIKLMGDDEKSDPLKALQLNFFKDF